MPEILVIPAGVIMPKDLIMWLRKRRDEATERYYEAADLDDAENEKFWAGSVITYQEVLMHVQRG